MLCAGLSPRHSASGEIQTPAEREREGGREGEREGGREGGRERGREGERERERGREKKREREHNIQLSMAALHNRKYSVSLIAVALIHYKSAKVCSWYRKLYAVFECRHYIVCKSHQCTSRQASKPSCGRTFYS